MEGIPWPPGVLERLMEAASMNKSNTAWLDRVAISLAMACGLGRIKKAPGTFGSLPGLALGFAIHHIAVASTATWDPWTSALPLTVMLALVIALAWWCIARTERVLGIHDDQRIVIDEVAGQAIAVCALPISWAWYVAAFALFRFFDITKPGLIGRIDRDGPGAFGTLMDDVVAGIVTGLLLLTVLYFLPDGVLE